MFADDTKCFKHIKTSIDTDKILTVSHNGVQITVYVLMQAVDRECDTAHTVYIIFKAIIMNRAANCFSAQGARYHLQ